MFNRGALRSCDAPESGVRAFLPFLRPLPSLPGRGVTIEVWVMLDRIAGASSRGIIVGHPATGVGLALHYPLGGSRVVVALGRCAPTSPDGYATLPLGVWSHVVGVWGSGGTSWTIVNGLRSSATLGCAPPGAATRMVGCGGESGVSCDARSARCCGDASGDPGYVSCVAWRVPCPAPRSAVPPVCAPCWASGMQTGAAPAGCASALTDVCAVVSPTPAHCAPCVTDATSASCAAASAAYVLVQCAPGGVSCGGGACAAGQQCCAATSGEQFCGAAGAACVVACGAGGLRCRADEVCCGSPGDPAWRACAPNPASCPANRTAASVPAACAPCLDGPAYSTSGCGTALVGLCGGGASALPVCAVCVAAGSYTPGAPGCAQALLSYTAAACAPASGECGDAVCHGGQVCCGIDVGGAGACATNCSAMPSLCGGVVCGAGARCCLDAFAGAVCAASCEPSFLFGDVPVPQTIAPRGALGAPGAWASVDLGVPVAAPLRAAWAPTLGCVAERSGYAGRFAQGAGYSAAAGTLLLLKSGRVLSDVELSVRVTRATGDAGVAFAYTSPSLHYAVTIGRRGTTLLRRSPGTADVSSVVLAQRAEDAVPDGVFVSRLLRVTLVGPGIRVYVDGVLALDVSDAAPLPGGQLGLFAVGAANATFCDVLPRDLSHTLTVGGAWNERGEDVAAHVGLLRVYGAALRGADVRASWVNSSARFAAPFVGPSLYTPAAAGGMNGSVSSTTGLFLGPPLSIYGTLEALLVQFPPGYDPTGGGAYVCPGCMRVCREHVLPGGCL